MYCTPVPPPPPLSKGPFIICHRVNLYRRRRRHRIIRRSHQDSFPAEIPRPKASLLLKFLTRTLHLLQVYVIRESASLDVSSESFSSVRFVFKFAFLFLCLNSQVVARTLNMRPRHVDKKLPSASPSLPPSLRLISHRFARSPEVPAH